MTERPNPYAPATTDSVAPDSQLTQSVSTWVYNFRCLAGVTITYSIACAGFAMTRVAMPEVLLLGLVAVAAIASAWANIRLGPRIGWDRGGLPVVLVVFMMAFVAYCSTSLILGGMLYFWLNPTWEFLPYP